MMKTHEEWNGRSYPVGVGGTLDKITQWGRDRNIIGGATSKDQLPKLMSEIGELADKGIAKRDLGEIKDGIGDAIVVLAMIAGIEGISVAECIEHAFEEIKDRKGVLFDGVFVKESDPQYAACMAALGKSID